jgi:hypothetical protein
MSKSSPQHPILKHSVSVLPFVWETKFHTHTKQQVKLWSQKFTVHWWGSFVICPLRLILLRWLKQESGIDGTRSMKLEADHSPSPKAEVKNDWGFTSIPIRLRGVVLS